MEITEKLLIELQNRLKIGNRRGVHLNAIPGTSRYKFDLARLADIDKNLPLNFVNSLLTELPLKFNISLKDMDIDLNAISEDESKKLIRIANSFENLINQTNTIESEKGINTFGFGFPILVRRDQTDNKLTVAPILIWSLKIKKTKEYNSWEILRGDDDPIYINEVLINHLQSDSGIKIEQIPNERLDDGLIERSELLEICINIIKSINRPNDINLEDIFIKKLATIKSISERKNYEKLVSDPTNSIIEFAGLFSIFEVQKQNIINDYDHLIAIKGVKINCDPIENHFFQPISSVPTDPSQQGILNSLSTTRNVLIQGPPGTGKSQSLTAILINALENDKKTVVVCEKRTALEVLYNALEEKGISHLSVLIKDIIKDRKKVVDSVRDRINSVVNGIHNYSKEDLDYAVSSSLSSIEYINDGHRSIDTKIIGNKNWTSTVGKLLASKKNNSETFNLDINKNIFSYDLKEYNQLCELVQRGQDLYNSYQPFIDRSFLNSLKLKGENKFIVENQIKDDFDIYKKQIQNIRKQIQQYETEYYSIRKKQLQQQKNNIQYTLDAIIDIFLKYKESSDFYNEDKTNGHLFKFISTFSKKKKSIIHDQIEVATLFKELFDKTNISKDFYTIPSKKTILDNKAELEVYKEKISIILNDFENKIRKEYKMLNLLNANDRDIETATLLSIKNAISTLKSKISRDAWVNTTVTSKSHEDFIKKVENLIETKERYFNDGNDYFSYEFGWFNYYNSLSRKEAMVVDQLMEKENWERVFSVFYLDLLLHRSISNKLPTDDRYLENLKSKLSRIEKEQIKYIKNHWTDRQSKAVKKFKEKNTNLPVESLYNKRAGSKHRRLSLREIVKVDIDLFTTFFPVILTTPDVASNLFKDQNKYFDIVIFDEASQLRLEENLPALLKGKQVIVAGDEHQMPPSNYFSKMFDDGIEDEDEINSEDEIEKIKASASNSLLDCESLLDFADLLDFKKKYLDFHYRSKHPYLIDFSNYAFYSQRLQPLPNEVDYIPIEYINVDGIYHDNSNDLEAEKVLSILENGISRLPNGKYPTIGIATFNIHQRNLILSKINDRRKFDSFKDFNKKISEFEKNGFFVKNLENIQGDERDIIILSTTYGTNKAGKFEQRFGQINQQKGYKLLNVIITRAKLKIYVCTSVPEDKFLNFKDFLIAEGSNNSKAVFYAYLAYAKSVSEQNSDMRRAVLDTLAENATENFSYYNEADTESEFEDEVYEVLKEHFDPNKIKPQFQFAGFRIDLVYDTLKPGLEKIAIECDGAKFHSSQEAYLHDLHRQKILEEYGFKFYRIWSTNWFQNTKQEEQKLIKFIKEFEEGDHTVFKKNSTTRPSKAKEISAIDANQFSPSLSPPNHKKEKKSKDIIKVNNKVIIEYLNANKKLKIHLVEKVPKGSQKSGGISKIDIHSQLGSALKGRCVGETVKFGSLDRYVKILEIIR